MADIRLLLGDCLEVMDEIEDGSVDMVLADPPFATTNCEWDREIPFEPMWKQLRRVCKPNAAILLFSQQPFTSRLVMSNPGDFRYEWIVQKKNATGFLNANRMPLKAHENVLVFYRRLPTYNPQFTPREPYRRQHGKIQSAIYNTYNTDTATESSVVYPVDVLTVSGWSQGKDRKLHRTQKPVSLLEYFIRTYTGGGETVLDFCMGSGSTGVACLNTGRNFIGIEINKEYFDVASERINSIQNDTSVQTQTGG